MIVSDITTRTWGNGNYLLFGLSVDLISYSRKNDTNISQILGLSSLLLFILHWLCIFCLSRFMKWRSRCLIISHEIQSMVEGRSGSFCYGFPQAVKFMKKGKITSFRCCLSTSSKKIRNKQVIHILRHALHTGEGITMIFLAVPTSIRKSEKVSK